MSVSFSRSFFTSYRLISCPSPVPTQTASLCRSGCATRSCEHISTLGGGTRLISAEDLRYALSSFGHGSKKTELMSEVRTVSDQDLKLNDKSRALGRTGVHRLFSASRFKAAFDRCTSVRVSPCPRVCVYVAVVCVCCFSVWVCEYVPVSLHLCVVCIVSLRECVFVVCMMNTCKHARANVFVLCMCQCSSCGVWVCGMCASFCFQCFRVSLQIAIPIIWCDTLKERNDDLPYINLLLP